MVFKDYLSGCIVHCVDLLNFSQLSPSVRHSLMYLFFSQYCRSIFLCGNNFFLRMNFIEVFILE